MRLGRRKGTVQTNPSCELSPIISIWSKALMKQLLFFVKVPNKRMFECHSRNYCFFSSEGSTSQFWPLVRNMSIKSRWANLLNWQIVDTFLSNWTHLISIVRVNLYLIPLLVHFFWKNLGCHPCKASRRQLKKLHRTSIDYQHAAMHCIITTSRRITSAKIRTPVLANNQFWCGSSCHKKKRKDEWSRSWTPTFKNVPPQRV